MRYWLKLDEIAGEKRRAAVRIDPVWWGLAGAVGFAIYVVAALLLAG
jgi:hypothetical protein